MDTTGTELIAAALQSAAMLVLRQLGYGARQSSTSLSVLALLEHEGPTRISALAATAGLSQPAMTGLVGRLHEEGVVMRFSDPYDGRATLVDICQFPLTRALAEAMMTEAQAVAGKLGISFRVPLEKRIAGAEKVGKHKTSMLQDIEAERPPEIEALVG